MDAAEENEIEAGQGSLGRVGEQMCRFGQDRLACHHGPIPAPIIVNAGPVDTLAAVDQADESAGVEEELTGHDEVS